MEPILKDDPIYLKNLLGRSVLIKTVDNKEHNGLICAIDPVYKTVVLQDKCSQHVFIMYHAITTFEVLPDTKVNLFNDLQKDEVQNEDLELRKSRLMRWLRHMFIEVKEDGSNLQVEDYLVIGPPYTTEDCLCDNTIVLERIRKIIDVMPSSFT